MPAHVPPVQAAQPVHPVFTLSPQSSTPLVVQIVDGFRRLIEEQSLRPGAKVPSVRQFAQSHQVSVFTVVEAYDRLVAQGLLVSRPNQGFFVKRRPRIDASADAAPEVQSGFDTMWYLRKIFENRHLEMKPGCGWLPDDWLFEDGVRRALRQLSAEHAALGGYGSPKGYGELRRLIVEHLTEQEIAVNVDQVLLTQGSSQALDLAARRLVRAGDPVLVDEPGYANLMFMLRFLGAKLIPAPRTPMGYDLAALEAAIVEHKPKVFFTQPRLQSPIGASAHLSHLHRVLQLAEKHDITIVENDIYADLDPDPRPSLASLDQINRVVYINSYSKTISPNIRVGYVLANPELVEELAQLKMLSGLTSPELGERLVYGALTEGRWRRHLKSIRDRLASAQQTVAQRLVDAGFELFCESKAGMYLWARHPDFADSAELSIRASEAGIMLGPGHLFLADMRPTDWLRFNVAFCLDERVFAFLEAQRRAA